MHGLGSLTGLPCPLPICVTRRSSTASPMLACTEEESCRGCVRGPGILYGMPGALHAPARRTSQPWRPRSSAAQCREAWDQATRAAMSHSVERNLGRYSRAKTTPTKRGTPREHKLILRRRVLVYTWPPTAPGIQHLCVKPALGIYRTPPRQSWVFLHSAGCLPIARPAPLRGGVAQAFAGPVL